MITRITLTVPAAAVALLFGAGQALANDTYTVESGDTLSHIAVDYGVPGGWPALYELNRKVVGDNPHLIFPGQVLALESETQARSDMSEPEPEPDIATSASKVRPATGAVTSPYGMRSHPVTGVYKLHGGTDYAYGNGVAWAAAAGVATLSYPEWAGNLVTIAHGGGVQTRYAHLASVSVSDGDRVAAGDVVGRIGARGLVTGAHLHFEVLIGGDYIDPERWLGQP